MHVFQAIIFPELTLISEPSWYFVRASSSKQLVAMLLFFISSILCGRAHYNFSRKLKPAALFCFRV